MDVGGLGAVFVYMSPFALKVRWFKRAAVNPFAQQGWWSRRVEAWIDGH